MHDATWSPPDGPHPVTAPSPPVPTAVHQRQAPGTPSSRPGGRAAIAPARSRRLRLGREVLVFAAIGVASTIAYAVLYLLLRGVTGAVAANAVALLLTAVGNTAANRRFTFGVRSSDRASIVRDQLAGLVALGVALAITTLAATALDQVAPAAGRLVELAVLVVANGGATVARFALLRAVITHERPAPEPLSAAIPIDHRSL